jgi:hypothetical protein
VQPELPGLGVVDRRRQPGPIGPHAEGVVVSPGQHGVDLSNRAVMIGRAG